MPVGEASSWPRVLKLQRQDDQRQSEVEAQSDFLMAWQICVCLSRLIIPLPIYAALRPLLAVPRTLGDLLLERILRRVNSPPVAFVLPFVQSTSGFPLASSVARVRSEGKDCLRLPADFFLRLRAPEPVQCVSATGFLQANHLRDRKFYSRGIYTSRRTDP